MADNQTRITDQTTDTALQTGDYVIVDSSTEGTRKFDLGGALAGIQSDIGDVKDEVEQITDDIEGIQRDITDVKGDFNHKIDEITESSYDAIALNIQTGMYSLVTKEYFNNSGYRCAVIEAQQGDEVYITTDGYESIPIAMFYSGTPSASTYIGYQGDLTTRTYTNEFLNIPSGTTHIALNCRGFSGTFEAKNKTYTVDNVVTDITLSQSGIPADSKATGDAIEIVKDSILEEYQKLIPLNIQTGAYPITTKEYWGNTGYNCAVIEADDTDEIRVTAKANTNVPIALFYSGVPSASTYIGYYGEATEEHQYTNELLTIPTGTTHIVLNTKVPYTTFSATTTAYKAKNGEKTISANYDGSILSMQTRYTSDSNLLIKMGKRGGNNLFDFISFDEVKDNGTINRIITNTTDFFGPYKVRAVSNTDGDLPDNWTYAFVGGNHQYNNAGSGSTPTARGVIDSILFDNAEAVENEDTQCSIVKVKWTNYIQGQNTKKADGTGREILREEYTLTYDGRKFEIEHAFIPLEDVIIVQYYGLQLYNNTTGCKYYYIGGMTRSPQTAPVNSDSGNKKCRKIIAQNDDFSSAMEMYDEDLGNWDFAQGTAYSIFTTTDRKAYFSTIQPTVNTTFAEGEYFYFKGAYTFEKTI